MEETEMNKSLTTRMLSLAVALLPLAACENSNEPFEPGSEVAASQFEIPAPTTSVWDKPSIVDIAIGANPEEFNTLVAAVVAADLVDVLNGNRQFTVFAPTDDAFWALGLDKDNIGSLGKEALTNILLYHVAPGSRPSQSVVTAKQIRMMNKDFIYVDGTQLEANNSTANIVATDIDARNGTIHVIDAVLLP
jgi:uncharacterized surface protein with fasciclin (FAS1) repeats